MKDLIITGAGYGWQDAPRDNSVDTWGITKIIFWRQTYIDMLWNMHDLDSPDKELSRQGALLANRYVIPVMTLKKYSPDNLSIEYPLAQIKKEFNTDYFANTLCYAIAYAIWTGYKKIHFYGINLNGTSEEYIRERPCVEYWLGRANERGVDTIVHGEESSVLRTYNRKLYGYETEQTLSGSSTQKQEEDLWREYNSLGRSIGIR